MLREENATNHNARLRGIEGSVGGDGFHTQWGAFLGCVGETTGADGRKRAGGFCFTGWNYIR